MASKRRNMFYENNKQGTTEIGAGVWMWITSLPLVSRSEDKAALTSLGWRINWISWLWEPNKMEDPWTGHGWSCHSAQGPTDPHCIDTPRASAIFQCCPPQPPYTQEHRGCIRELVYPALLRYKFVVLQLSLCCVVAFASWCTFYFVFYLFTFVSLDGALDGVKYFARSRKNIPAVIAEVFTLLGYEVENQIGGVNQVMLAVGRRMAGGPTERFRLEMVAIKMATLRYIYLVLMVLPANSAYGVIAKAFDVPPNCVTPKDEHRYGTVVVLQTLSSLTNNVGELLSLVYESVVMIHATILVASVDMWASWLTVTSVIAQAIFTIGLFWAYGAEQLAEDFTFWRMEYIPRTLICAWKFQPLIATAYLFIYAYEWKEVGGGGISERVRKAIEENYLVYYTFSLVFISTHFVLALSIFFYSLTSKFKKKGGVSALEVTRDWRPFVGVAGGWSAWPVGSERWQFEGRRPGGHVCLSRGSALKRDPHLSRIDTDEAEKTTSEEEFEETEEQQDAQTTLFRIANTPNDPSLEKTEKRKTEFVWGGIYF
ncbi:hypothetical protein AAG570_006440 [Ranatra chinensis]|uniref:Uncharacterized protein n=1 Tax=Ranatra chinensis TaxID=642074 RepID=A0ABD0YU31_9HEMI